MKCKSLLLFSLFILGFFFTASAQYTCEPNLDFELGNLNYWNYYRGSNNSGPVWSLTPCPPDSADHLHELKGLIPGEDDPYGGFPVVADGVYSLKLGKDSANNNADGADYHVHVPVCALPGSCTYSLIYRYAVVFEDPGHIATDQPRFEILMTDSATGAQLPCNSFTFVSSSVLPGFMTSTFAPNPVYKPWTAGSIDLTSYSGKTIIISFKVGGCTQGGHWAYAYVDLNCGIFKIQTVGCAGGLAELEGPPGYQSYIWTDSLTFTRSYGTTVKVIVPVPVVTTTYALIIAPYPGYGCPDTLYARLVPSNMVTHPSHDTAICLGDSVKMWIGATDILPLTYTWLPTSGVRCPTCDTTMITPPVGANRYKVTAFNTGGCQHTDTINITVHPLAGPISGPNNICLNSISSMSNAVPGGTWTSSNTGIATVGSTTGDVLGVALGTAVISYSFSGICAKTKAVTVVPLPAPITGPSTVCVGFTAVLSDASAPGTWSSSVPGNATVGASTGIVTGVFAGTSDISFTSATTGCSSVRTETVIPLPTTILGKLNLCQGTSTTYASAGSGAGTWSSSIPAVGTIDPITGALSALTAGTTTLTYSVGSGCFTTQRITVLPSPDPITGSPSVCVGSTTSLTDPTLGGTWSSSSSATASVASDGTVTGITTGGPFSKTVTITYAFPSTCSAMYTVTVNPIPDVPSGTKSICLGQTTSLSSAPSGGTWSSSNGSVATIGVSTANPVTVTGAAIGTSTITYVVASGCFSTTQVTVTPNPAPITGSTSVCKGGVSCFSDATPGGTWSIASALYGIMAPTGCVTGSTAGTTTITYTLPGTPGCFVVAPITVNPVPANITGTASACEGETATLSDITPGGTWSSSDGTVATVTGGVVAGIKAGTATISYTIGGCPATVIFRVNPLPTPIIGATGLCALATTRLSDATGGGTWSASNAIVAIVASGGLAGTVTASSSVGTDIITYKLASTGCLTTTTVAVKAAPGPIAGNPIVCTGSTTTLSNTSTGGTWTSVRPTVATVDPFSGVVSGVTTGTALISYSLGGTCTSSITVTVIAGPPAITGTLDICYGLTTVLSDTRAGGAWSTSNSSIATVVGGVVRGVGLPPNIGGTATISYTVGSGPTACSATKVVTVNPLPDPIAGPVQVCIHSSVTVSDATPGGRWTSSNPGVVSINPTTGLLNGVVTGTATITYTTASGCINTTLITVNPLPAAISGPAAVCVDGSITLSDANAGGTWSSSSPAISVAGPVVTGNPPGGAGIVTYTLPSTGCQITATIKVNPLPAAIAGATGVCVGENTTLSDATAGGTWSASGTAVTINPATGVITGGSGGCSPITYTLTTTGCQMTTTVCINTSPGAISGASAVCVGGTAALGNTIAGGTWLSSNTAVATIDASGVVTGKVKGTSVITYTIGTGCRSTKIITVNPLPSAISGAGGVCLTNTLTLSDGTPGGIWSSSDIGVADIGSTSGIVSPAGVGTAVITYSLGCIVTTTVTVNLSPKAITGPGVVCANSNITLSDAIGGGVWTSSVGGVATVVSSGLNTATVTGINPGGTVTISYTLGGTCYATHNVTVNPQPVISGGSSVCQGTTLALISSVPGVWSSSNTSVASISSGGIVAGASSGTATITMTPPTGCINTQLVTVGAAPGVMLPAQVCNLSTVHLTNSVPGGTWSSASSLVTVDPALGDVTGRAAGVASITYTLSSGCSKNTNVTVNPLPAVITGVKPVCIGTTITLSSATAGGRWTTASGGGILTVNPASGVVTGIGAGTALISYTTLPTGCSVSTPITVNALPAPVTGNTSICVGKTTTLLNSVTGTWSSSNTSVATIGVGTGVATGIAVGSATITFTATASTCNTTATVNVFPAPAAIAPHPAVCVGDFIMLSDAVTGGVWTSMDPTIATIDAATGKITGRASGTVLVQYSVAAGCSELTTVIVNPNSEIIGDSIVCVGQSTLMIDTTLGGTWNTTTANASVGLATGVVTGMTPGTSTIVYTTPKGCKALLSVTVNTVPAIITGPLPLAQLCQGQTKTYSSSTPFGVWSSSTSVATITPSGVATGVTIGTSVISYTIKGCAATVPVTVNPVPAVIAGPADVCVGATVTMSDATPGGTWISSRTLIATVGSSTGIVTGMATGTSMITYTVTKTGCYANTLMNVNPVPLPVSGPSQVCVGSTITLTDPSPAGFWYSNASGIASVSPSGDVLGVSAGTAIIEYRYTATGCGAKHIITVNPLPAAISGSMQLCEAQTEILSDVDAGGTWLSSTPAVATIGLTTGSTFGVIAGTTTIEYTLPTGCSIDAVLTVNPLPTPISGPASVCTTNTATFTNATPGGTWSTDLPAIASVADPAFGDVTGNTSGVANVIYTMPAVSGATAGCAVAVSLTVTNHPAAIGGNPVVCKDASNRFTNTVTGGSWSTLDPSIASVDPVTGVVTGIAVGTTTLTYSMSAGCETYLDIRVASLPNAFVVTGGGDPCAGSGKLIGLNGSSVGINYYLYVGGSVATGPLAGTGIPLNFGMQTVSGTYTVLAIDAATGCSDTMTGNPAIHVIPAVYPTVDVTTGTGDTMVCSGAITTLSVKTSNEGSSPVYRWDINGTVVSISSAPYSYIAADGDVVTFTLTSSALCATPATVSDHVTLKVVTPAVPSATLSAIPGDTVCQGLPVTFTPAPLYGGSRPTYTWVVNTVPVSTGPTFTYVPVDLDIVYAKITSNYPCLVTPTGVSNNVQMKVDAPLIPHVEITATPRTTIAPGQTVNLSTTVTDAGTPSYQWIMNGIPLVGATSGSYAFITDASRIGNNDSFSVAVTSSDLCKMTTHQWIYITTVSNVGVKQVNSTNSDISVLPNPNKGEFNIKGSLGTVNDEEVSLEITDLLGQTVYKSKVLAKGGNIDTHVTLRNTLANGMYILNVRSETATSVFHVVIEQ